MPEMSPSFNLSDATMLKDVEFRLHEPNVKWITATLQTTGFKNLQQITILLDFAVFLDGIPETTRLEWQELDDLLTGSVVDHALNRPSVYLCEERGKEWPWSTENKVDAETREQGF